ncbi:hypothetical protein L1049_020475 [Liquidambar formosana]|uniref:Uncharacterized protein n=1 Tax=Liquidambar formosana TaxID=63359 RepID=A0AAP0SCT5_LIQFO
MSRQEERMVLLVQECWCCWLLEATMGMVIVSHHQPLSSTLFKFSIRQASSPSSSPSRIRHRLSPRRWLNPSFVSSCRLNSFSSRCSITNTDVHFNHIATDEDVKEDSSVEAPDCSIPIVHLKSDILETKPLNLLTEDTYVDSLLTTLPVLSERSRMSLQQLLPIQQDCMLYMLVAWLGIWWNSFGVLLGLLLLPCFIQAFNQ